MTTAFLLRVDRWCYRNAPRNRPLLASSVVETRKRNSGSRSGMRKSELCGLLWADVDLTQGCVRVRQQLLTGRNLHGKLARTVNVAAAKMAGAVSQSRVGCRLRASHVATLRDQE